MARTEPTGRRPRRGALLARLKAAAFVCASAVALGGAAADAQTPDPLSSGAVERTLPAAAYDGSERRRYNLHIPEGLDPSTATRLALVAVLHGCRQTHDDIMATTRFRMIADANAADDDPNNDFIVVFPYVTEYRNVWPEIRTRNCWGWWFDRHRREGGGEVADLDRLLSALEEEFGTDPARRYAAGLSSGAAMTVALGVAYSERMRAIGTVAGLPYGETPWAVAIPSWLAEMQAFWLGRDAACLDPKTYEPIDTLVGAIDAEQAAPEERRLVPLMVIQSEHDCVVDAANGRALAAVWRARHDAGATPVEGPAAPERDCARDGVPCAHLGYDGPNGRVVETVFYEGRPLRDTHYWPGDREVVDFAESDGPSATCLLLGFFDLAPRGGGHCQ